MTSSVLAFDDWETRTGVPQETVVQVQHFTFRNTWSQALANGTTFYATPLTKSITPIYNDSAIYMNFFIHGGTSYWENQGKVGRVIGAGSNTFIGIGSADGNRSRCGWTTLKYDQGFDEQDWHNVGYQYLDFPATTSTVTYTMWMSGYSTNTIHINRTDLDSNNDRYYYQPISTVTLMEIRQ